jgi:hypothetical protein
VIAEALNASKPSLRHLASHARIAIHIGEISPGDDEMAHRTRNKIAQALLAR